MSLITLDPDQNRAASHVDGPLLILAGAGAGKTATITERTARLIESGVEPKSILQLTFSRKAAREMFARLRERMGDPDRAAMPVIENFHAFGWKLIQAYPAHCGRRPGVSLLDTADQKRLMRQASSDARIEKGDNIALSRLLALQDALANDGLSALSAKDSPLIERRMRSLDLPMAHDGKVMEALRSYSHAKQVNNVVDFGDLITLPVWGMRKDTEWAASIAWRYAYVSVDEAQDTNASQYELIRRLALHGNLVMVGDDDQCIYEWRGARPDNLRRFLEDYQADIVRLDRNYRSTPSIVDMGSRLIAHNTQRIEKTPYSARRQPGDAPILRRHARGEDMAEAIAKDIRDHLDQGVSPRRLAILYRTNRMAQVLEPALIAHGVPYHIAQGVDLFERQEAQMLMAGVRAVLNPHDEMALRKLSALIEGVGEKTLERMIEEARMRDLPLLEGRNYIKGKARDALDDLHQRLHLLGLWSPTRLGEWALDSEAGNFGPWIKSLVSHADNPKAALNKRLNTLVSIDQAIQGRARDFADIPRESQWAEVMSIGIGTPDEDVDRDAVTLGTIFKVKGLEYQHVFIAGYSEGLMPMTRRDDLLIDEDERSANQEEERRLAYVGLTRGMQTVTFEHADAIDWGFRTDSYVVSRFADEQGVLLVDGPLSSDGAGSVSRSDLFSTFGFR